MKSKIVIRVVAFVLVLAVMFSYLTRIFTVSSKDKNYQWMHGIYKEPENSLDAIYIGSSNCYAFWAPNFAWEEYGIAVYPYTCSSQSLIIAEYLIKEARKTQPDAVFVVNINSLGDGKVRDVVMHRLLDFMKFSKNKLELTDYMCDLRDLSFGERMQYYFPLIRYHEKWKNLSADNFSTELNGLKGGNISNDYFKDIFDISKIYKYSDKKVGISEKLEESIISLLDYCEEEKVKIVFVTVPRAENSVEKIGKYNTVNQMISDRGFPVLDLSGSIDDIKLDMTTDYYDETHTNIHGSIKYTYYISEYLIENYGFKDKRQDKAYEDWNKAFDGYWDIVSPYVLDIELDSEKRDFEMEAPKKLKGEFVDSKNEISWQPVENADGYAVYKRVEKENPWGLVSDTTALNYSDADVEKDIKYYYRVVPYRVENGEKIFGNFQYSGCKVIG